MQLTQDHKARGRNKPQCLTPGQTLQKVALHHTAPAENRTGQGVNDTARVHQPCSDSPGNKEKKPTQIYCSSRTHHISLARGSFVLPNLPHVPQWPKLFPSLPMGRFRALGVVTMTTMLYPFPLILMSEKDNPAQGTEHWSRCQHSEPVFIHGNYKRCLTFMY